MALMLGAMTGASTRIRRCCRWLGITLGVVLAATAIGAQPAAAQSPPREYQLKAVFLFNFAQFVEWPEGTFPTPESPIVIGVLGNDPFGAYLDETVLGEKVNGHPLAVRRFKNVDEIESCHILFVSRSKPGDLERVLDSLKGRAILTVGDADRFAGRGGMIRFVTDRNKIRLHINLAVAEAANLKLSSKLLRPAAIVVTGKE